MSDSAHWLKPCQPKLPSGRHVLLYVEEKAAKGRIVPGQRNAWCADVAKGDWSIGMAGSWNSIDQLDGVLEQACLNKGETTLWVMRGWTDLVLSGLVELMDAGIITWRYVSLSGRSCLIKGAWRGRKITITALPNWTGTRWDSWADVSTDTSVDRLMTALAGENPPGNTAARNEQYRAVQTLAAIVSTCSILALRRIPPTAGAAGILLWRSWLGPRIAVESANKPKKGQSNTRTPTVYVCPIPSRPIKAANAERHTCYALTTRQLRTGLVSGPIYCMDLRSAYLVGMSMTPLPLIYDATLHKPNIDELVRRMERRTGCALVRVQCDDWYYPARVNGKVTQCKGRFWTWLAGAELVHALCSKHIAECWTAYLWHADCITDSDRQLLDMIKLSCERFNMTAVCSGWRSVYSALVGRFAGWQRVWKDSPANAGFGRWSQWVQADHDTGVVVPHRSIAGKVQYLAEKTDKLDSVPLMFGCVTAMVRWLIQSIVNVTGENHCYSIAADSIWMDQGGWQQVQRHVSKCGLSPDNLRVKAIYDRAWMTGRHVVVTERNGAKELHMPGVSNGAVLDSDGRVMIEHADDWDSSGEPRANKGIRRRKHRYSTDRIVRDYSFPARLIQPGETVSIPLLSDALLQRLNGERTVEDA